MSLEEGLRLKALGLGLRILKKQQSRSKTLLRRISSRSPNVYNINKNKQERKRKKRRGKGELFPNIARVGKEGGR